jgi:pimeloyl-ACP methyl ester carboxylesterase
MTRHRLERRSRVAEALAHTVRLLCCLALGAVLCTAGGSQLREAAIAPAAPTHGSLIVLPGIRNTRFHLAGFVQMARQLLPGFDVEIRTWGPPLLGIYNLRAHERNAATARAMAAEIAAWRARHPSEPLYLIGYSGGGAIAAMTVAALPADVTVDRLVLVAPALAADYPAADLLFPHVAEFVVNYASEADLQVGLGTRLLGTIDGAYSTSIGYGGLRAVDGQPLAEWRWQPADRRAGHRGNHVAYLSRRWQRAFLLPAIDPRTDARGLRDVWQARRAALGVGSD